MSRPNFDRMTKEEIGEYFDRQEAKARAEFAGRPQPRISEVKRNDYPHWESVGWAFYVMEGRPARVRIGGRGARHSGVTRGLCRVGAVDGELVLVVEVHGSRPGVWAVRRADGEPWTDRPEETSVGVPVLDVECVGWPVGEDVEKGDVVPGPPRGLTPLVVRTARLDDPTR